MFHCFCDNKVPHVVEAVGGHEGEADDEHVRAGVGEGPQSGILLLARRVPEVEGHAGVVNLQVLGEAVEHGGQVVRGEGACGEGDQEPSLPNLTISTHNTLDASHGHNSLSIFRWTIRNH